MTGYVGTFAVLALGLVMKVLLARSLEPDEFGMLLVAQAVAALGLLAAEMSLPEGTARFVAIYAGEATARGVVKTALESVLASSVALTIGLLLVAAAVVGSGSADARVGVLMAILVAGLPVAGASDVLAGAARGIGQLWVRVLLGDLARGALAIAGLLLLLLVGARGSVAVAFVLLATLVISCVVTMAWWVRSPLWPVQAAIRYPRIPLFRYCMPLFGATLLGGPIVVSVIPLLLSAMVSPAAVANYNIAATATVFVNAPMAAVEVAALPMWARADLERDAGSLRRSYTLFTRLSLAAGLVLFQPLLISPDVLLAAFFSPRYVAAAPLVQVLAAMALFSVAMGPNAGLLKALGKTRLLFNAQLGFAVVTLGVTPLLITAQGQLGAALAFGAGGLLLNVLLSAPLFRRGIHPFDAHYAITLLMGGGLCLAAYLATQRLPHTLLLVVAVGFVYAILLAGGLAGCGTFGPEGRRFLPLRRPDLASPWR